MGLFNGGSLDITTQLSLSTVEDIALGFMLRVLLGFSRYNVYKHYVL